MDSEVFKNGSPARVLISFIRTWCTVRGELVPAKEHAMNVIPSRLPAVRGRRAIPRGLRGLGLLNGVLGAALIGAGIGSYFVVAGTSTPATAVRTATVTRGVVLST